MIAFQSAFVVQTWLLPFNVTMPFEAVIVKVSYVLSCYLLARVADYLVHVAFRDTDDLERIHADILTRLPHVARLQSTLSLRTVKQETALPI
jgi:Lrp/AsnC family transcriptional regulator, leucine-responsive regulatory protein